MPCPCCQGELGFLAWRRRIWIQSTGETAHLLIRRLKCKACRRIHHELPDLLVPYKRNELFWVWLSECYQNKPHSALGKDVSPETAYRNDPQAIRFADPQTMVNAFLHVESRKVDKSGCLSFMNRKYEVGVKFLGCNVDVVYDPADISEITVEYEGHKSWTVRPLEIGTNTGGRPKLPEHLGQVPADSSRLLKAAKQRHAQRQTKQEPTVSYRSAMKEDNGNV